ncbi:hypothetical protein [Desulfurivibrio alkaliphilus]|uniref:Uncharacterized protein n=1 Tax=Desulfurivibrio alkaliphilus (strain DSM 19089 / UNIQEM U267 / AHT2) TaxID=589865 RepID=D6Z5I6_DESAT|nr:hypothetical protein [Desulfurivibrio alkaliphilus]ADH86723.1 hypothetical protein DaAHT2_2049 [Desulfurivibrio alkaliphilus AHT 2]
MKSQEIFQKTFGTPRDPRSPEYRAGVLAALRFRFGEATTIATPHQAGTAQADAFFAGLAEGHALARAHHKTMSASAKIKTETLAASNQQR